MRRKLTLFILFIYLTQLFSPGQVMAQSVLSSPQPAMSVSPAFNPPVLRGIKLHRDNPFRFDFMLDHGDAELSRDDVKLQSTKLIKYFLAGLTIPEKDIWVNLSPYERNRMMPVFFGKTELGRDLLALDYLLKKITSSLVNPENEVGQKFWRDMYREVAKKFGTADIPVNSLNKVWIVPEKATVYENARAGSAYVTQMHLKVMLEEDYLAFEKGVAIPHDPVSVLGSEIIRQVVIPVLTREVNEGKSFAPLRQIYSSLIIASWCKNKIKDSLFARVYSNKYKIQGVNITDATKKEEIYQQYLTSFTKGVLNYIQDENDPVTQEAIPRRYFSGGIRWDAAAVAIIDKFSAAMPNPKYMDVIDAAATPDRLLALTYEPKVLIPARSAMSLQSVPEDETAESGSEAQFLRNIRMDVASMETLRARIRNKKLGSLVEIRSVDGYARITSRPVTPTAEERKFIRALIESVHGMQEILDGVAINIESKHALEGRLWSVLFELLYRSDGSANPSEEYRALYADNRLFEDPAVMDILVEDENRPHEDYLVDFIRQRMTFGRSYKILVFASGSGVLVNNILKKIPNVSRVVEYDASDIANKTADRNRRRILPEALCRKVTQITADVEDFDAQLKGEEFDFIVSVASLRLMNTRAKNSVINFIKDGHGLRKDGVFLYMENHKWATFLDDIAQDLASPDLQVERTEGFFSIHRHGLFYILLREYSTNSHFREYITEMMALDKARDLHKYLYKMAGRTENTMYVLSAVQQSESRRQRDFNRLAQKVARYWGPSFSSTFTDPKVTVTPGPSSRALVRILKKDPDALALSSYEITVTAREGVVGHCVLYDGRSIGVNTLMLGQFLLQDPRTERVIINQHDIATHQNYEAIKTQVAAIILEALGAQRIHVNADDISDELVVAATGLTRSQIISAIKLVNAEGDNITGQVLMALTQAVRTRYPSQQYASFPGAGTGMNGNKLINHLLVDEARALGYDSLSGVISLPDGFHNLIAYQKTIGFKVVMGGGEEDSTLTEAMAIFHQMPGATLMQRAWNIARRIQSRSLILMQRALSVKDSDAAAQSFQKGGIDLSRILYGKSVKSQGEIVFDLPPSLLLTIKKSPGFVPTILNIRTIESLQAFLEP